MMMLEEGSLDGNQSTTIYSSWDGSEKGWFAEYVEKQATNPMEMNFEHTYSNPRAVIG